MAEIIYANGRIEQVAPANGSDFSLEEMQKVVGGYNEEGKLEGLDLNITATYLYGRHTDCVVGDVLVCDADQIK